jgi:hypothetical protein
VKLFNFFLVFLNCVVVYGQKKPIDTLYYDNGSIKRIAFKQNKYISYPVDVYYRKNDTSLKGFQCIDTMYKNIFLNRKNKDALAISQYLENGNQCNPFFGNGKYQGNDFRFYNYNRTYEFYHILSLFEDNTILDYRIGVKNNNKIHSNGEKYGLKNYFQISNDWEDKTGSKINNLKTVTLDSFGSLEVFFNINNRVEKIKYDYRRNIDNICGEEYCFDTTTGFIKEYGFFDRFYQKIGLWQEYHINGNIASKGYYQVDSFVDTTYNKYQQVDYSKIPKELWEKVKKIESTKKPHAIVYLHYSYKQGIWEIFDESGYKIRTENWEKGVLVEKKKKKKNPHSSSF